MNILLPVAIWRTFNMERFFANVVIPQLRFEQNLFSFVNPEPPRAHYFISGLARVFVILHQPNDKTKHKNKINHASISR